MAGDDTDGQSLLDRIDAFLGKTTTTGNGLDSFFSDKGNMAGLGAAAALLQSGRASRMPITTGEALGNALSGGIQGAGQAQKMQAGDLDNQMRTRQITATDIQNALSGLTLQGYQQMQGLTGGAPTGLAAISGNMGRPGTVTPKTEAQKLSEIAEQQSKLGGSLAGGQPDAATLDSNLISASAPTPTPTPALTAPPQPGASPTAKANANAPAPLFNFPHLQAQYAIAARTPGMQQTAAQILGLIQKGVPEGAFLTADGSLAMRPGYSSFVQGKGTAEQLGKNLQQIGANGSIQNMPGAVSSAAELAGATKGAEANAQLPAELAKIGATGTQTRQTEGFKAGLSAATDLVKTQDPDTGADRYFTRAQLLDMANGAQPPAVPENLSKGDAVGSNGTAIPAAPQQQKALAALFPRGVQASPSAMQSEKFKQWAEQEKTWSDLLPTNAIAEQRFMATAKAMKEIETGAWTEKKAEINAMLKSAGMPQIFSADPAEAQKILKNSMAATLDTLRGTFSRPSQMEMQSIQKSLQNPDLQPEANLSIISQAVGKIRWENSLVNDWAAAKQMGWRDPQEYQRQWIQKNPPSKFIEQTEQEIGPLKGMAGALPAGVPKGSTQVGTYGGKPVFELPDGTRKVLQ